MTLEIKNGQQIKALENIEKISIEAAEYLRLFVDMFDEFEVDPYKGNPVLVLNCFPKGIDEDQNELIGIFEDVIRDSADEEYSRTEIADAFRSLSSFLADKKVVLWALAPVFEHFGIAKDEENELEEMSVVPKKVRFRMPNLLSERSELNALFSKCGLVCDPNSGKGSHEKWTDPKGEMKGFSNITGSNKIWMKNVIKELLEKELPIERIKAACDSLDIDFEVL